MIAHGARAVERCRILAKTPFSETEGSLFRFWLGPAYRRTVDQVGLWMEEAGMSVRMDATGSLVGRYEGTHAGSPAVMIGSHLDTVRNGGAFDGNLGVMLGIETVSALHEAGVRLPFAVEVMGFGDEEGSRFPAPMMCSRAMAALIDTVPDGIRDGVGQSVAEAMEAFGLDPARLKDARRKPGELLAFIEPHIEQGPCIEAGDGELGVVTAIAAQTRQRVVVRGQSDHAGTTPMILRRDALAGAAEMILAVEHIGAAGGSDHVATVGQMHIVPNTSNVIPGEVWFSLDMRAATDEARDRMAEEIREDIRRIAANRELDVSFEATQLLPAAACTPGLVDRLARVIADVTGKPAQRVLSGAGHDAMAMVGLCPMAMMFIRSPGGLSHHPDETVRVQDVELAHRALLAFVKEFQS
ncbi:allantoate amidohydrolase [Gluconobacter morbifer]|uniref:Allantoate amidohydrolase n=1 Tax=Gluconobacter morbifer G707 TaxID=1088869 RepID=G6XML3_9PROT|nr:allantoate amidohydrolase [Gluconobacter morbifer]EHH67111.1 allantoate amidohydrolase [Gluconobacter morbifer G707]